MAPGRSSLAAEWASVAPGRSFVAAERAFLSSGKRFVASGLAFPSAGKSSVPVGRAFVRAVPTLILTLILILALSLVLRATRPSMGIPLFLATIDGAWVLSFGRGPRRGVKAIRLGVEWPEKDGGAK
jgi:hypothetical protein